MWLLGESSCQVSIHTLLVPALVRNLTKQRALASTDRNIFFFYSLNCVSMLVQISTENTCTAVAYFIQVSRTGFFAFSPAFFFPALCAKFLLRLLSLLHFTCTCPLNLTSTIYFFLSSLFHCTRLLLIVLSFPNFLSTSTPSSRSCH